MTDGRPYDFINMAFKAELLLAGYAVVSMDFRGTGKPLHTCLLCLVIARYHINTCNDATALSAQTHARTQYHVAIDCHKQGAYTSTFS